MARIYTVHSKTGNLFLSEEEIIENAKEQEEGGVTPFYSYYDYRSYKPVTPPGWLIWSTMEDGACVVYKNSAGRYRFITGWQGDFVLNLKAG